jgi:hypothetical protein
VGEWGRMAVNRLCVEREEGKRGRGRKKGYSLTLPVSHTNTYGRLSRVDCYGATGGHTVDHGWVTSHVIAVGATQCHSLAQLTPTWRHVTLSDVICINVTPS